MDRSKCCSTGLGLSRHSEGKIVSCEETRLNIERIHVDKNCKSYLYMQGSRFGVWSEMEKEVITISL